MNKTKQRGKKVFTNYFFIENYLKNYLTGTSDDTATALPEPVNHTVHTPTSVCSCTVNFLKVLWRLLLYFLILVPIVNLH